MKPRGVHWVLLDGELIPASKARFGVAAPEWGEAALVESLPVKAGRPQQLSEHLARLSQGARALGWSPGILGGLDAELRGLALRSRLALGGLRLRLWRSGKRLAFCAPRRRMPARGLRLLTTPTRHYGPEALAGRLKSNTQLTNWMARLEAQAWAEDGLRLTPSGLVAEGIFSNLVIRKGRRLLTPPLHLGILEGVTRARLLELGRRRGLRALEAPLTRYDLYTAEAAWICSSFAGPLPVKEVDGRPLPARP